MVTLAALFGGLVAGLGAAAWLLTPRVTPPQVVRVAIELPVEQTVDTGVMSPDGSTIVYVGYSDSRSRLFVRTLDAFEAAALLGTEGASQPFFAPDGSRVGFVAEGRLRAVTLADGRVDDLADAPLGTAGATWSDDGSLIVASPVSGGLLRIVPGAAEPEQLTRPDPSRDERAHGWPVVLPGGRGVLFTVTRRQRATRIAVLSLEDGEWRHLFPAMGRAALMADARLIYQLDAELLSVEFDLESLETRGAPRTVVRDVAGSEAIFDGLGRAGFSVSATGTLLYQPGRDAGSPNRLVWVDRQGGVELASRRRAQHRQPRVSPDGRQVAVTVADGVLGGDVWLHDLAPDERVRLTDGGGDNRSPVWSPDGRWLAFASNRTGAQNVFVRPADPDGDAVRLLSDGNAQNPVGWSRGAGLVSFYTVGPQLDRDIWTTTPAGEVVSVLATQFAERSPVISPDGALLAYVSDEAGRDAVHVRSFPDVAGGPLMSAAGATEPVWSRDGGELFYRLGTALMVVGVEPVDGDEFRFGDVVRLFERPLIRDAGGHLPNYDVSPDGQRFLMVERADPRTTFRIVLNWWGGTG